MRTKIIGLTGGIGSGKTTIANYFESLGVPVYIADEEAKKILFTPDVVAEVSMAFGSDILTGGLPDRAKLASVVFNTTEKLEALNAIIHPRVRKHFREWISGHKGKKFIIRETAILFESNSYKDCDKIILITAPLETKIERVMHRDGISRDMVLKRMAAQWDDGKKEALSDFIINNTDINSAKEEAYGIFKVLNNAEN
jgi:dephospho-CoA kinase